MTLDLPYPPSVNKYWRHNRGRTHISHEGRAFRHAVMAECWAQLPKSRTPLGQHLDVRLVLHAPDRRRRDIDNVAKATLDALVHAGVIEDDGHIDHLVIVRGSPDPDKRGRVHVIIGAMQ